MRDLFEWFEAEIDKTRPWLILGKGPSFSKRTQFDLSQYYTLSLNHAVREQSVTVAHMIDYDVIEACEDAIINNAEFLVLPWIPHVDNSPGKHNLGELTQTNPTLKKLEQQGRLLWYNLSTATERREGSPVVGVKFFSAEAGLNLLATAGVRKIRSLGVDGGTTYSREFHDLKEKTLLSNRRKSFDGQFKEIAGIIMRTGIDYAPLDAESPIRVYVGCTEAQMLAVKVLEYSIRKHASMSVEVFPLHFSGTEIPTPKDPHNRPRTPFSFQRFLVPALAGHRGRAIYLDSDMLVFKDISALWTLPCNGAGVIAVREPGGSGRRPQFSVMVLNCDALKWDIDAIIAALDRGELDYEKLMYEMPVAKNIRADIDPEWNSLERFSEGVTALLHYTDMNTQPWVSRENSLAYLWMRCLFEAVDTGFISLDFIKQQVMNSHVRPSLSYQVEHRIEESLLLPKEARRLDKDFIAPYRSIPGHESSPWLHPAEFLRAVVRHYYRRSPFFRVQRGLYNRL